MKHIFYLLRAFNIVVPMGRKVGDMPAPPPPPPPPATYIPATNFVTQKQSSGDIMKSLENPDYEECKL